ncbi:xanthine phosphoribosyltransferase [Saccharomycopsis crataegensis]|uniref:Xanthine phosphoribosyltransferase n=1 Tax=Saccharomycopsis crataegensis TaxID=43959 RepID=A0AAV5QEW6_9ASCO|nr:xanthine phosphoribosyltransferase [Saccharomycopsis crataegensis]
MSSLDNITEVPDHKLYISYNNIHKLCQQAAQKLKDDDNIPDIIIAIGGGGFIPARILRSFLKKPKGKNIPIQAIGLSLYEAMGDDEDDTKIGKEVIRTQWLDFSTLDKKMFVGKKLLIVDEVDDTRTTLHYAYNELLKDIELQQEELKSTDPTNLGIFVLHNKNKEKKAQLPEELMNSGNYLAAVTVDDAWIAYPWDAADIDLHTRYATLQGNI